MPGVAICAALLAAEKLIAAKNPTGVVALTILGNKGESTRSVRTNVRPKNAGYGQRLTIARAGMAQEPR